MMHVGNLCLIAIRKKSVQLAYNTEDHVCIFCGMYRGCTYTLISISLYFISIIFIYELNFFENITQACQDLQLMPVFMRFVLLKKETTFMYLRPRLLLDNLLVNLLSYTDAMWSVAPAQARRYLLFRELIFSIRLNLNFQD